jgi:hypothetical protein
MDLCRVSKTCVLAEATLEIDGSGGDLEIKSGKRLLVAEVGHDFRPDLRTVDGLSVLVSNSHFALMAHSGVGRKFELFSVIALRTIEPFGGA